VKGKVFMIRVLFDAFYHMMPGHRMGDQIAVGGYQTNFGRYTPGDCYHPNGLSFLHADIADRYEIKLLTQPYSDASLFDADILLVTNPDYPLYPGASPYRWTPKDVDALLRFASRGGGVLLTVNSFLSRPDFWEENFDIERVSLLFDRLGIRWDPNYMSNDDIIEPAAAGSLCVGYGQGGRAIGHSFPDNVTPLLTYENNVYGLEVQIGAGKLVILGDTGMLSNGLICFPGFDNAVFVQEILQKLTPPWCSKAGEQYDYLTYSSLSAAPGKTGLTEDLLRSLQPGAAWMVDHHYRHLTWQDKVLTEDSNAIWKNLPVPLDALKQVTKASFPLHWVPLEGHSMGPEFMMEAVVCPMQGTGMTDLHIIGRAQTEKITWADLCQNPQVIQAGGTIEKLHGVFEMRVVLDSKGQPLRAKWSQGQITYARDPKALHYGYVIVLNSQSGLIVPKVSS
jgi:hypothetical protein